MKRIPKKKLPQKKIPGKFPQPNELQQPPEEVTEKFDAWSPQIIKQIDDLVKLAAPRGSAGPDNRDLVRQMIVTALKTHYAALDRGSAKILSRSMRELRYGFRVFSGYKNRKKLTIFGSARTPSSDPDYQAAVKFARLMAENNFMVITGAGPGIMQAGNEGAGRENSFGINIRLPYEQASNEVVRESDRFIDCRFFFTRKLMFLKETHGVAFFPGGFGTHDEGMETLTLVQTGKSDMIPIVFIDAPGGRYWSAWLEYMKEHLLKNGKISPQDMHLFKVTDSVEEAVQEVVGFYHNYHSMRFVRDELVIRLNKPVTSQLLKDLNRDFSDILVRGHFNASGALLEEEEHRELPRIVFQFNRLDFGRLRQLINRLNKE